MSAPKPTRADLHVMMRMEPKRAMEYLQRKGFAFTWDFHEMEAAAHARAFTVAKATSLDILQDLKNGMKGRSLREYQKDLEPILRAKGWWGKQEILDIDTGEVKEVQLGSPRRLKTIYQTNMQSAYMAGRYVDAVEAQDSHPYAMYIAVQDASTRSSHAAMHGRVFRLDDPVWQHICPPNGYGCRCRFVTLTEAEVKRRGLVVESSSGKLGTVQVASHRDPDTGQPVLRDVTTVRLAARHGQRASAFRADVGFDGGPAASHIMDDVLYAKAQRALGGRNEAKALDTVREVLLSGVRLKAWTAFVERALAPGARMGSETMSVGVMGAKELALARKQGVNLKSGVIYVRHNLLSGDKAARHLNAGNALTAAEWQKLPQRLANPKMVLWDTDKRNFLYVLDSDNGSATKLIVRSNRVQTGAVKVDDAATVFKVPQKNIADGLNDGTYQKVR